MSKGSTGH